MINVTISIKKRMITLIVAHSINRVIGIDNKLPWHLPEDLKRFKELTLGKTVVMGRKTYESIGKPLPKRTNVILSCTTPNIEGCLVYDSPEKVMEDFEDFVVIGGETIYKIFLPYADWIESTIIEKEFEGDTYFPETPGFAVVAGRRISGEDFDYSYVSLARGRNYYMSDEEFNRFLDEANLEYSYGQTRKISRSDFDVENGWLGLVKELLEGLITWGWDRKISQVKQKYGGLRVYIKNYTDPIGQQIQHYENLSFFVCEKTGDFGKIRTDLPWIMTLSEDEYLKEKEIQNGRIQ